MKNKLFKSVLSILLSAVLLAGCGETPAEPSSAPEASIEEAAPRVEYVPRADIVILYTNDTHTYINNEVKDDEGNVSKALSFASVKARKAELEAQGKHVLILDAGDHVQGTAFGGMDEGEHIINIMNETGYDAAVLGNHEFDYGMFRTFAFIDKANYSYLSCDFYSVQDNKLVLDPYKVFEFDGVKIAIVGISTPESITSSAPTYFMDESGENFLYNFYSGADGSDMYKAFQTAVDAARSEADYVIGLGHLGEDPSSAPYRSTDLIANTHGIDAFIDGHSHTTNVGEYVQNDQGLDVLLTQTGCYFSSIGELTISDDGSFTTQLMTEYSERDTDIDASTEAWVNEVNESLGEKIALLDTPLYIMNANNPDERLIRRAETNLGDFVADGVYYYFNEYLNEPIDIAVNNGGGIRANLEPGDMTYLSAKTVAPFGNIMCVIEATGQQVLDCLEHGSYMVGVTDEESGAPAEFGGFLQVAGIAYDIDTTTPCTISMSDEEVWISGPSGDYRVKNVVVYNKETGAYEPLDLEKTYRVGGINYILRNQGNGMSMFKDCKCVVDYVTEDYLCLSQYMMSFTQADGVPVINTANSPLSSYEGYLMDYENPLGSGRINVIVQ